MPKYVFIKLKDAENEFDISTVKMKVETVSLPELVEEFELFLKACGFNPEGTLDFVVDNDREEQYSYGMETNLKAYIESKKYAWAPSTLRSEQHRLTAVAGWLGLPPAQFYEQATLKYKPYTVRTLMQRVAQLKEWQGDVSYTKFIRDNARLFKNVYTKKLVALTFEQAKTAIEGLQESPEKQACLLMLTTGMRIAEALTYDGSGRIIGKGAKARTIYSNMRVEGKTDYTSVYRTLKTIGLKPHDLRKLAASQLAANGFKEADLMAIMGWSNIQTASNYLQPMVQSEMQKRIGEVLK